jgi:hypothetical protein
MYAEAIMAKDDLGKVIRDFCTLRIRVGVLRRRVQPRRDGSALANAEAARRESFVFLRKRPTAATDRWWPGPNATVGKIEEVRPPTREPVGPKDEHGTCFGDPRDVTGPAAGDR